MAVTLLGLQRPREAEPFARRAVSDHTQYTPAPQDLAKYMETLANVYAALHAADPTQGYDAREADLRQHAKDLRHPPTP
jgi:hypothetical protein